MGDLDDLALLYTCPACKATSTYWYVRDSLEAATGAMPAHWWVSETPIVVEYAP